MFLQLAYSRKLHRLKRHEDSSDVSDSSSNYGMPENTNDKKSIFEEKKDTVDMSPRKSSPLKRRNAEIDELWDDSEEEYPVDLPSKDGEKDDEKTSGSKRRGKKAGAGHRRSFEEPESDIEGFEDDSKLEKQLKPLFENPKWESECEPFVMTRSVIDADGGENDGDNPTDQIPAAINRYLKDYQKEGVRFLHSVVTSGLGAVLGDDMGKKMMLVDLIYHSNCIENVYCIWLTLNEVRILGLGKTVEVISLIAALQKKTGTKVDLKVIKERYRVIEEVRLYIIR